MAAAREEDYESGWRIREERRRSEAQRMLARLEECLIHLKQVLVSYEIEEAYIFGSFASSNPRPDSDLDLAVSGADHATWYRLSADIERVVQIDLDLVDLDLAPDELRKRIISRGRRIYP